MRVLLFTGKGGVGKSTVAAATALRCAELGYRTIAVSADPAHSLADAFDLAGSEETMPVRPGLVVRQADARARLEAQWDHVQRWLADVWRWSGAQGLVAEELAVVPGLDEVFALCELEALVRGDEHDVVVIDCGPTAETLRLLSLPSVLDWYLTRALPTSRRVAKVVRPMVGRVSDLPMPGDEVFAGASVVFEQLGRARDVLLDRHTTAVRLVVQPERVVLAEARRTYGYLSLFGYSLDAVIANRVQRTDQGDGEWQRIHAAHLADLGDDFAPVPVDIVSCMTREPCGLSALGELADDLYGSADPTLNRSNEEAIRLDDSGAGPCLDIHLPFLDHDDIGLTRKAGDLLVRVGPYRRAIGLPDTLRRRRVEKAALVDGWLSLTFGEPVAAGVGDG